MKFEGCSLVKPKKHIIDKKQRCNTEVSKPEPHNHLCCAEKFCWLRLWTKSMSQSNSGLKLIRQCRPNSWHQLYRDWTARIRRSGKSYSCSSSRLHKIPAGQLKPFSKFTKHSALNLTFDTCQLEFCCGDLTKKLFDWSHSKWHTQFLTHSYHHHAWSGCVGRQV